MTITLIRIITIPDCYHRRWWPTYTKVQLEYEDVAAQNGTWRATSLSCPPRIRRMRVNEHEMEQMEERKRKNKTKIKIKKSNRNESAQTRIKPMKFARAWENFLLNVYISYRFSLRVPYYSFFLFANENVFGLYDTRKRNSNQVTFTKIMTLSDQWTRIIIKIDSSLLSW